MDTALVIWLIAGSLIPSVAKMVDSIAYRNRAAGDAEVIRARRTADRRAGRRGKHHG
ncbi:hypothetical protein ACH4NF_12685 [Streptomyces sp. NPDC017248]|uniref:hypothetical protein n=1 Tax=unclassified Streptomyces TaxID=2593676 RepID=UPI003446CB02